ncbi:MAG: glycosyltransferase family 2 protein [Halarchaeum sp.]
MSLSVTVGIPTRNNEDTIRETLTQLVEGTRPPDRIVIVDASDDRTTQIIGELAAESEVPIDVYGQSKQGRGVGRARQDIYEQFEGDLLACLDTNVQVDDTWLERHVAFHEANPEYDVLSAAPLRDVDGPVTDPKRGFYFQQANCTVTREAIDRIRGWDPWLPRGEDWDASIRLWRSGARAYARNDLSGETIDDTEDQTAVDKALQRPSSVAFLRKYGLWYARFHPVHPLGDSLSLVSILGLVATPLVAVVAPTVSLTMLIGVVLVVLCFLYFDLVAHYDRWWIHPRDFRDVPRFFVFGYTALREFVAGDRPWNYGGLDEETSD